MQHFAVFGSPLRHSLSPHIHHLFAKHLGIELTYKRIFTIKGELKTALTRFREQGGAGANITLPLKQEAFDLCDFHRPAVETSQVVNTIGWNTDGTLWGENTDGEGLIRDLSINLEIELAGKNILLLGAGGAAKGILFNLLTYTPHVTLVHYTQAVLDTLKKKYPTVNMCSYSNLINVPLMKFDLVINATSASLQRCLPPLPSYCVKNALAIDLAYQLGQPTVFVTWAKAQGAKAAYDGIGMLVEQAALSFTCWHQLKPDTPPVIHQLRAGDKLYL